MRDDETSTSVGQRTSWVKYEAHTKVGERRKDNREKTRERRREMVALEIFNCKHFQEMKTFDTNLSSPPCEEGEKYEL